MEHRIAREVVELSIECGADPFAIQQAVSRLCREELARALDEAFTAFSPHDAHIRIDRLEIDLGTLSGNASSVSLPTSVHADVTDALSRCLSSVASTQTTDFEILPKREARFRALRAFLETGTLPWWADRELAKHLERELSILFDEPAASILAVLAGIDSDVAARRIARTFSVALARKALFALLEELEPSTVQAVRDVLASTPKSSDVESWTRHVVSAILRILLQPWSAAEKAKAVRAVVAILSVQVDLKERAVDDNLREADVEGQVWLETVAHPRRRDVISSEAANRTANTSVRSESFAPLMLEEEAHRVPRGTLQDALPDTAPEPRLEALYAPMAVGAFESQKAQELQGTSRALGDRSASFEAASRQTPNELRKAPASQTELRSAEPLEELRATVRTGDSAAQDRTQNGATQYEVAQNDRALDDSLEVNSTQIDWTLKQGQSGLAEVGATPVSIAQREAPSTSSGVAEHQREGRSESAPHQTDITPSNDLPERSAVMQQENTAVAKLVSASRGAIHSPSDSSAPIAIPDAHPNAERTPVFEHGKSTRTTSPSESPKNIANLRQSAHSGDAAISPKQSTSEASVTHDGGPSHGETGLSNEAFSSEIVAAEMAHPAARTAARDFQSITAQQAPSRDVVANRTEGSESPELPRRVPSRVPSPVAALTTVAPGFEKRSGSAPLASGDAANSANAAFRRSKPVSEFWVENAGLVLLHPFLRPFFSALGLLKEGRFAEPARERAALILDFLATGEPPTSEHGLALNKILVGCTPEQVVPPFLEITEQERSECEDLLRHVIKSWGALGATSVAGFRRAFLMRPGKLTRSDAGYRLFVESRPYDMLLERLPWGVSHIRLSWMVDVLQVER